MPLSNIVVGPSAANDLHGGDTAREMERRGVRLSTLRRFGGRDAPSASWTSSSNGKSSALIWGLLLSSRDDAGWVAADSLAVAVGSSGGSGSGRACVEVASIRNAELALGRLTAGGPPRAGRNQHGSGQTRSRTMGTKLARALVRSETR